MVRRMRAVARWRAVVVVAALVAAAASPAAGQTPTVRRVELDEAVRIAIERNPTVANAAEAVSRAETVVNQARAAIMPSLSAGLTNITLDQARGFSGGVTQPQNQFAFSATASMPLFTATRWAAIGQARDQVLVASRSFDDARQQVALATAQAYLGVIAQRRQIEIDRRALENARAHFTYADQRLQGGAGSRVNQVRAAQAVAAAEARLETSTLLLARAQEALGVLLVESGPVDAGAEPAFNVPQTISEDAWQAARPDLQLQTAIVAAARQAVEDTRKAWLPSASVSFDPQYVTPSGLFQPSRTWRLVFSVSQPIVSFGLGAERAARQVALNQANLARTAVEIQARSDIRVAQAAVASHERAVASARLASERANEVLRITTSAFELGATTNIEVIDAQRSAQDAETAAALAEDALRRARLDLLVAIGQFP